MEQTIISTKENYKGFHSWIEKSGCKTILLVCDRSIQFLGGIRKHLDAKNNAGTRIVYFSGFQPNPLYENIQDGVKVFRENNCDGIIAIGGGSAIDVAKCIKLYSDLPGTGTDGAWLHMNVVSKEIPFLAIPTTAGTGSEATRYAVIYYEGEKKSILSETIIPDAILMDPDALSSLPLYQKKATMMDALSHAIESYWSINSTEESKEYSRLAIQLVMVNMDEYLANTEKGRNNMLMAANIAGKAINITQTTAGHAMCYKITSLFGCAHGHAAILCNRILFPWMISNIEKCVDPRGKDYVKKTLNEIGISLGSSCATDGAAYLRKMFDSLNLEIPVATCEQYEKLKNSVNPERLKNNPITLTQEDMDVLYHLILR